MWNKIKEMWNRQPEITIELIKPLPRVEPQKFELKGLIMQSDNAKRVIGTTGTSRSVTIPKDFVPFLRAFESCSRFLAYGKEGLIFICEGAEQ